MKKILIIISFLVLALSGCSKGNELNEEKQISNLKTCPDAVLGLEFSYPEPWGDCYTENDREIYFETKYNNYNIKLFGSIIEVNEKMKKQISLEQKEQIDDLIIYNIDCGGVFTCSRFGFNNDSLYEIVWEVLSDQSPPDNLEYIWRPDHDITREDVNNILRTIKRSE